MAKMLNNGNLLSVAKHINEQFVLSGVDRYSSETGICKADFIAIEPTDFDGDIYAIDGSNIVVCDWSVAHLNRIRAGYVTYKGRNWQRTVITYDDVFWADPRDYAEHFDHYLKGFFGLNGITFKESDLDRLSSYFRELQEYVALSDAINEALAAYSCSAECLGYPHALFRAHRDIRITKDEGHFLKLKLMNLLGEMGVKESKIMMLMEDYHDVLEMRHGDMEA